MKSIFCCNLKGYWMRNNQNRGWNEKETFIKLTKYNTLQQREKSTHY